MNESDRPTSLLPRIAFVALALSAAAPPAREHQFTGRWRMDTTSIKGNVKPTVFRLAAGGFEKDDNGIISTDGALHKVPSDGYVDETSISVESDHIVKEIDKIHGKLAYTVDYIVSPDGSTLTWHVSSFTNPNGQAVKSETVQHRVGLPISGTHLITGKWERVSVSVDSKSDWILSLAGKHFSWRTDEGTGYAGLIGGRAVKIDGDSSGARALITRPRPDLIVETDLTAKSKIAVVLSMQLLPDNRTLRATASNPRDGKSTTAYLRKIAD